MAKKRASPGQFAFTFDAPQPATLPAALAGMDARIARTVAEALKDDERDRAIIAVEMSLLLDDEVTKLMLDAYASQARDGHNISFARMLALIAVTNRHDLLDRELREIGAAVLVGEEIHAAQAGRRAAVIAMVEELTAAGMPVTAAVNTAVRPKVSAGTIYNWLKLVKGVPAHDRLPALAPRRKGGGREAEVDAGAWDQLKGDYLRPERPTFSSCYWRAVHLYAAPRGITLPNERTLFRKLEREVDPRLVIAMRKGKEAVKAMIPAQQRSVAHMHAMEMVNIDGHKFDVFVRFPDGKIDRPILVGIQDIYSRMMLAWRCGDTESALLMTRRAPFVIEMRNVPFEQQKQLFIWVTERLPRFVGGKIDSTGNGAYLGEVAKQKFGPSLIEEVKLSQAWYAEWMPKMKSGIEDRRLLFPANDNLVSDLRQVKMVRGIPRVPDDARHAGTDGLPRHGDFAPALALANAATFNEPQQIAYRSVPKVSFGDRLAPIDDTPRGMAERARGDSAGRFGRGGW